MMYRKSSFGYLIRLDLDEKVSESLKKFFDEQRTASSYLLAVGALKSATLSFYDLPSKKYLNYEVSYPTEVVSFSGNVSWIGNDVIIHAHTSLSDKTGKVIGGHFVDGVVGPTLEVLVLVDSERSFRAFDQVTGLNLLDLK